MFKPTSSRPQRRSVPLCYLFVLLACLSFTWAHVVPSYLASGVAPTRTTQDRSKRGTLTERASAKVTECLSGDQCTLGCCSSGGYCGFGPEYCATDVCNAELSANGTCSHLSECDAGYYPGYFDELWGKLLKRLDKNNFHIICRWYNAERPNAGTEWAESTSCPLNVCCSKFGFCELCLGTFSWNILLTNRQGGTTEDFCGDTTWPEPSCSGSSAMARTIGYYEGWNQDHPCDRKW